MILVAERQAAEYRVGLAEFAKGDVPRDDQHFEAEAMRAVRVESKGGVTLVVVEGSGHHIQNDAQEDIAAGQLLDFVRQSSRN